MKSLMRPRDSYINSHVIKTHALRLSYWRHVVDPP